MEIKTFKIRLSYFVYNPDSKINHDTIYIDETDNFNKLYGIRFEWNWLNVADDYSEENKEYYGNYNKLNYGYDDNDVYMEVEYKGGFCCIELLANTPLNKHVTVYDSYRKQLITRTLFDWIKLSLNSHLSDGIGENPVAYYGDRDNEVWLSDIITDEPLDKTGCYFYVGEPIRVIDDPGELKKIEYPDYIKLWNDIEKKHTEYYDDENKLVKHCDNMSIYHDREKLNYKAIKYALNKIAELYDKG